MLTVLLLRLLSEDVFLLLRALARHTAAHGGDPRSPAVSVVFGGEQKGAGNNLEIAEARARTPCLRVSLPPLPPQSCPSGPRAGAASQSHFRAGLGFRVKSQFSGFGELITPSAGAALPCASCVTLS